MHVSFNRLVALMTEFVMLGCHEGSILSRSRSVKLAGRSSYSSVVCWPYQPTPLLDVQRWPALVSRHTRDTASSRH